MTLAMPSRPLLALALLNCVVAVGAISAAWIFQWIGYEPCHLCLDQRIPYYIGVPLMLVAIVSELRSGPAWLARAALVVVAVAFLCGAVIAVYQAGAQWGYWKLIEDCTADAGFSMPTQAGQLLGNLDKVHVVDCTKITWSFLGLSFAGWNAIVSTGLTLMSSVGGLLLPRRLS